MNLIKQIYQISKIGNNKLFLIFFLPVLFALFEGIGVGMLYEILIYVENTRLSDSVIINESYIKTFFKKINFEYSIYNIFIFAVLSIILRYLIEYRKLFFFSQLEFNFQFKLRQFIYNKYLNSNLLFFIDHSHGSLLSTIGMEVKEGSQYIRSMAELLGNIILGLIYLLIIFYISFKLSVLSIVIFSISTIIVKVFSKNVKSIAQNASNVLRNLNENFQEFLYSTRLIKIRRIEEYYEEKITNTSKKVEFSWLALAKKNHLIYALSNPFLIIGIFLILIIAIQIMKLSLSELGIFLLILNKISNLIIKSNSNIVIIIQCSEVLKKIFDLTKKTENYAEKFLGTKKIEDFRDRIEFKNVSFGYNSNKKIFNNLNFSLLKNDKILIFGESGSGKSTLVDLILQLQKIQNGKILIDRIDTETIQIDSYRKLFGYVPQTSSFFFGTLRDNLSYGLKKITDQKIKNVLKLADCEKFVDELPDKLDTNLGELGLTLSGGQRQRISIARALIEDPKILVLDEPTSSLDPKSMEEIKTTLSSLNKKMTLIIISHSSKLVNTSDKVIFLSNGRLFFGFHKDLFIKNKEYKNFFIKKND